MNMHQIKERFVELGREDALGTSPLVAMTDELLWRRAKRVVGAQLPRENLALQDWLAVRATARGAYMEGWLCSSRLMTTVPRLRIVSQVWALGYRSVEDRDHLRQLFDAADEQASCRLLVDIRYRPLWPYHPEWSRKQLQARYRHQYRYLHALGNRRYDRPDLAPELVDEQAGLACLINWLQMGWDVVLLCACAGYATCHRRLVAERLQQAVGPDPRVQFHLEAQERGEQR